MKTTENLQFNRVIKHEDKMYLAIEIKPSKVIDHVKSVYVDKKLLIRLLEMRLQRCLERLEWAISTNNIVEIASDTDSVHVCYQTLDLCPGLSNIGGYSIPARDDMQDFLQTLRSHPKEIWVAEDFDKCSWLQVQQLIKAAEEGLSATDPQTQEQIWHKYNTPYNKLSVVNWLHGIYVQKILSHR